MAVHTPLTGSELERLATQFGLGAVERWHGLPAGSINSNFEVVSRRGRFFLTLREGKTRDLVEGEVRILDHLAGARFPVPRPISGTEGPIGEAVGRPVLVFPWITGEELPPSAVQPDHLLQLGQHLARMHHLLEAVAWSRPNPYGSDTVAAWLGELGASHPALPPPLLPRLDAELAWTAEHRDPGLPRGLVHADLFVDNVKWIGGKLAAILDFEMACRDVLALDLAIVLLAWCFRDGAFDRPLVRALLAGYGAVRPLREDEREGLYAEARFAALRYTVSRIRDFELSPLPPERLERKSYRDFLSRLEVLDALGPARFLELCGFLRAPVSR
jgi:homoserine kinase type II